MILLETQLPHVFTHTHTHAFTEMLCKTITLCPDWWASQLGIARKEKEPRSGYSQGTCLGHGLGPQVGLVCYNILKNILSQWTIQTMYKSILWCLGLTYMEPFYENVYFYCGAV